MPRRHIVRPFASLFGPILTLALTAVAGQAQDYAAKCALKDILPSVTTTGTASLEVVPDFATISLGVMTERPRAADAAKDNAAAVQGVVAEIKAQGIESRDIRTTSVALTPVYDENRDSNGRLIKSVPRGYSARNDLAVRIRQIGRIGGLVASWIDKGANRVDAIEFDFDQKAVKYDALRVEAVRDALRRAQSYVNGLGLRLGRVLSIAPPSSFAAARPAPLALARAAPQDGLVAVPVEPGVETLRTEIEVTWELAQ